MFIFSFQAPLHTGVDAPENEFTAPTPPEADITTSSPPATSQSPPTTSPSSSSSLYQPIPSLQTNGASSAAPSDMYPPYIPAAGDGMEAYMQQAEGEGRPVGWQEGVHEWRDRLNVAPEQSVEESSDDVRYILQTFWFEWIGKWVRLECVSKTSVDANVNMCDSAYEQPDFT